jgi:hypothetical protein
VAMQEVDTDGNGTVDTKEFLDWIVERKQATDLVVGLRATLIITWHPEARSMWSRCKFK